MYKYGRINTKISHLIYFLRKKIAVSLSKQFDENEKKTNQAIE